MCQELTTLWNVYVLEVQVSFNFHCLIIALTFCDRIVVVVAAVTNSSGNITLFLSFTVMVYIAVIKLYYIVYCLLQIH